MNELSSVASASRITTGNGSSNNNDTYSTSIATSTTTPSATRLPSALATLRSPRRVWFCALFISSLIAMGSTFEAVKVSLIFKTRTFSLFSSNDHLSLTCYFFSLSLYRCNDDTHHQQSHPPQPNTHPIPPTSTLSRCGCAPTPVMRRDCSRRRRMRYPGWRHRVSMSRSSSSS